MKVLHFLYRTTFYFRAPVTEHSFALRCIPSDNEMQKIQINHWHIEPTDSIREIIDSFGNHRFIGICSGPHVHFEYEVSGIAYVDGSQIIKDRLFPIYRYESKFVKFTPEIRDFYNGISLPEDNPVIRAEKLMNALHSHFIYESGVTNISTTAGEAFVLGKGVCQDYAHIFLALCRIDNIPARYVVGLIIGEGATHAWVEIHNKEGWIGFDPTNNQRVNDDYIKIAHGRDYEDCVVDKGTFYGKTCQHQKVYVYVEELI